MDVITHPCWAYSQSMLLKGASGLAVLTKYIESTLNDKLMQIYDYVS